MGIGCIVSTFPRVFPQRTLTPPILAGRNPLVRARERTQGLLPDCIEHLVTSQVFEVRNPETGKPMMLNGKPYVLSIALCGRFTEWFPPEVSSSPCPLCAAILASRNGMQPHLQVAR